MEPPAGATVVCVDEKPNIQALERLRPLTRSASNSLRLDFEYIRHGTRALIAAFNPHSGEVFGQMRPSRSAEELLAFMEGLAKRYPTGPVHVIWDNLNTHYDGRDERWRRFNERHGRRFHFHYTPKHASWVNLIECWFSVLQRRVLRYASLPGLSALDAAIMSFIEHWNLHERKPFRWTFKGYPDQMGRAAA